MKRLKNFVIVACLSAIMLFSSVIFSAPLASSLSGSDFIAGRIMDDAVFFNPNTMNPGDIQAFLNAKMPICDTNGTQLHSSGMTRAQWAAANGKPQPPYICLKDYSQSVGERSADAYCGGTVSAGTKSSAQIIYDVANACGVNPKVLLVLLQKEQSLVTDDWPWPVQYEKATGFGCPDTAPCDPEFAGFFNQIWYAARQFQRYAKQPQNYNYRGGATSFVQYNPNAGCGGTNVQMQNQTTAGLYNYTPYQPNAAALNNLYGTGDGCSAYGNRNFWRLYIDWFGSPHSNTQWAWMYEGQWAYSNSSRTQLFSSVPTTVPNGKVYVRVKARNMGTQTWDQSLIHIAVSRPIDRAGIFAESGWVSNSRAAKMLEATVTPGSIATFEFALQAPSAAGTYSDYFNLVAEGNAWMNDPGLFFTINANNAVAPSNSINTMLNSGNELRRDDYLLSPDSQTVLTLQRNGNLALYSNFKLIWETGTQGNSVGRLVMQADGNAVLYNGSNQALWSTQTDGNPNARLTLQTDGNMVAYSFGNQPLWATYTLHNPDHLSYVNTSLEPGLGGLGRMYPGQQIETADRRFKLVLQRDGNLVLYSPSRALWATGTDGRAVAFLAIQPDGNLVLYDRDGKVLWTNHTTRFGLTRLIAQPDGNLVLYDRQNIARWHTSTAGAQ